MIFAQPPKSNWAAEPVISAIPVGTTTSPSDAALADITVRTSTVASYHNSYAITYSSPVETTVENLTPSIIDSSQLPAVVRLTAGTGKMRFTTGRSCTVKTFDLTDKSSGTATAVYSIDSGPAAHSWGLIKSAMDAGGSLSAMNASAYQASGLQWNPACWASGWDFSGVPIFHLSGFQGAGALVTRRHLWVTHHFSQRAVGSKIWFLDKNNIYVPRTIIGISKSDSQFSSFDSNQVKPDIQILTLDSNVPASVASYPVADSAWAFADQGGFSGVWQCSGVWLDQERKARFFSAVDSYSSPWGYRSGVVDGVSISNFVSGMKVAGTWSGLGSGFFTNVPSVFSPYSGFFKGATYGDSGSAMFIPKNSSELIVNTLLTGPSLGSNPNSTVMNAIIRSADLNAIANGFLSAITGYTVTVAADPSL